MRFIKDYYTAARGIIILKRFFQGRQARRRVASAMGASRGRRIHPPKADTFKQTVFWCILCAYNLRRRRCFHQ